MSLFPPSPLPPADATFTVREVARLAACTIRTVRHYIREGVVPAPAFRSSKTRYDRSFLLRLRAARTLRQQGLHVNGLRARLSSMSAEEMIQLAGFLAPVEGDTGMHGAASPAIRAPGVSPQHSAPGAATETATLAANQPGSRPWPAGFLGPYRAGVAPAHERWDVFEVCPGVKLLVGSEADPEAWRVANEIVSMFAPRTG